MTGSTSHAEDTSNEDMLMYLRDEQVHCRADVANLQARCTSLERKLDATAHRLETASAAASRVPLLVGSLPRLPRLPPVRVQLGSSLGWSSLELSLGPPPGAGASSVAASGAAALAGFPPEAAAVVLHEKVEGLEHVLKEALEVLRGKLHDMSAKHHGYVTKLDASLDAARTGIFKLAKDLHADKEARKKVYSDLNQLAKDIGRNVVAPALKVAEADLQAKMVKFIRSEVSRLEVAMDTRCQLAVAELRGQAQLLVKTRPCTAAEAKDKEESAPPEDCGRSLSDWLPEHADGDVASTRQLLSQLGVWEQMAAGGNTPDDMLNRPTTRFLHRVVVAIKHATGYPAGMLEDWPGPADAKLEFVQQVWDGIAITLGLQDMEFKASEVLRCTNRKQTRRLLQLLAIAAAKERQDWKRPPRRSPSQTAAKTDLPLAPLQAPPGPQHNEDTATSICWH